MAAENGLALRVLNYMYMYTNMKGAFVYVYGEIGLLRAHVKLLRAHVKLLREHIMLLRAHVKLSREHVIVIACARDRYYVRTWSYYVRT